MPDPNTITPRVVRTGPSVPLDPVVIEMPIACARCGAALLTDRKCSRGCDRVRVVRFDGGNL